MASKTRLIAPIQAISFENPAMENPLPSLKTEQIFCLVE